MLPITSLYASILGLLVIFLSFQVVYFRRSKRVEIGDGGDSMGQRLIRAHANAVEYVPIALILLAVTEINGAHIGIVHGAGAALVVGRLLHPLGFIYKPGVSFGRFYGTVLTWSVIVVLSFINCYRFFKYHV